jgi:hypothetical protein
MRYWVCVFGPPEKLLSDQGRNFEGDLVRRMCEKLGTKKISTSPYHPQCDGMIERLNRTLIKDLRAYVSPDDKNWDELLPLACFRYNTSVHAATGLTPFAATFGTEAFEFDAELGLRMQLDDRTVQDLPARLRQLHTELFTKSLQARRKAEKYYNKAVDEREYEVGDRVLVYDNEGDVAVGRKLRVPWLGPYRVTEKLSKLNYVLRGELTGAEARSHVNRMARLDERLVEPEDPADGVFPDTRRYIRSIMDMREQDGLRKFKLKFRGRNGFKWVDEQDLPPLVVTAYLNIVNDQGLDEL